MRKALAWAFIILNVFVAGLLLCGSSNMRTFNYFGLWQDVPSTGSHRKKPQNIRVTATIAYEDGKQREWTFFRAGYLASDGNAFLRPDFTRYLAREQFKYGLRPTQIQLVKHGTEKQQQVLYTYKVPKEIRQ